ncbi:hypothetical protein IAU60_000721 [Kwoniella sp. DSM 27419]
MSQPRKGAGRANDPVLLDLSEEEDMASSHAGPSRLRDQPMTETASRRQQSDRTIGGGPLAPNRQTVNHASTLGSWGNPVQIVPLKVKRVELPSGAGTWGNPVSITWKPLASKESAAISNSPIAVDTPEASGSSAGPEVTLTVTPGGTAPTPATVLSTSSHSTPVGTTVHTQYQEPLFFPAESPQSQTTSAPTPNYAAMMDSFAYDSPAVVVPETPAHVVVPADPSTTPPRQASGSSSPPVEETPVIAESIQPTTTVKEEKRPVSDPITAIRPIQATAHDPDTAEKPKPSSEGTWSNPVQITFKPKVTSSAAVNLGSWGNLITIAVPARTKRPASLPPVEDRAEDGSTKSSKIRRIESPERGNSVNSAIPPEAIASASEPSTVATRPKRATSDQDGTVGPSSSTTAFLADANPTREDADQTGSIVLQPVSSHMARTGLAAFSAQSSLEVPKSNSEMITSPDAALAEGVATVSPRAPLVTMSITKIGPDRGPSARRTGLVHTTAHTAQGKPTIPVPDLKSISTLHSAGGPPGWSRDTNPVIELNDSDLDCLTSEPGEDYGQLSGDRLEQFASDEGGKGEVKEADAGKPAGLPVMSDSATEADVGVRREENAHRSSPTPSIEIIEVDSLGLKTTRAANQPRGRWARSASEEDVPPSVIAKSRALEMIRAKHRQTRSGATSSSGAFSPRMEPSPSPSPEPVPKVKVIPTRTKRQWQRLVENGGESEVEDLLDDGEDAPSSEPSAVEIIERDEIIGQSPMRVPHDDGTDDLTSVVVSPVKSVISSMILDPPPPPHRIGKANRVLNTLMLDDWNKRKPTLTKNPSLHRAVFEAYMRQCTSQDEPEADEIRVVNDIDAEGAPPDFEFQYSNGMLYNPVAPDPELGLGCDCEGPCDPNSKTCSCVKRQEAYFYDLGMKGFAYDSEGHIHETSVSVWECGKNCGCPPECMNRVIQRGRGKDTKIELFKTKWKGWGVRARAPIAKGTFLGIYAGELITEQQSEERGALYAKLGRTYLFDCDGWQIANPPRGLELIDPRASVLAERAALRARLASAEVNDPAFVYSAYSVDAFHYGFTRYFNHSCDPNLAITQAYVHDFHPERPILVIFARRPIKRDEELCISYKGLPDDAEDPVPAPVASGRRKGKKSKTSASAHITSTTKGKVASKDRCMCKTARCDGRMFNYGQ